MALTDAYATAAEYRARTNKTDTADDADILEQLKAVSRFIEARTGRVFNTSAGGVVRYFDGKGYADLDLDDVQSLSALAVDADNDGTYEIALDSANYRLLPHNAAELGRPYTRVELVTYATNAQLGAFPRIPKGVKATGTWGWTAVPDAIREATVQLTRDIRDLQESGAYVTLENIDAAIRISPRAPAIVDQLLAPYDRRLVQVGFV